MGDVRVCSRRFCRCEVKSERVIRVCWLRLVYTGSTEEIER